MQTRRQVCGIGTFSHSGFLSGRFFGGLAAGVLVCGLLPLTRPSFAQAQAQASVETAETFARGAVIARVECASVKEQSYALFLPANYDAKRAWPIIYALDPVARGAMPVEMLREAAEKYGYIVVGSNNSRNGPGKIQSDAMQAMWADTHARFSIDAKRVYFTGFSGGARAAAGIAQRCGDCAAGVIAHGAGFLQDIPPAKDVKFSVYAAIGLRDYNYPELVALAGQLDELKVANRLRRFDGTHQWATPEVWMEAVEWMELRAMKENRRTRNPAFAAEYARRAGERAAVLEKAGDALGAYDEYRQLARELDGLTDTAPYAAKTEQMERSAALVEARKREQRDIVRQEETAGAFYADLERLRTDISNRETYASRIRMRFTALGREAERRKDTQEGLAIDRAFHQVGAALISTAEMQAHYDGGRDLALLCWEIYSAAYEKQPGPFYQVARLAAELGQKKKAIRAMERAVANGLPERAVKRFVADFPAIAVEKGFQRIPAPKA